MHRSVGLLSLSWCVLALPAWAQVPKPDSTANGSFPATPPAPAPAPAAAPAPHAAPTPVEPAPPAAQPLPPAALPPPDAGATPATPAPAPAPPAAPPPTTASIAAPGNDPAVPNVQSADALAPVRARRPFFIGGELGWNGLSGLGVNFSYHPHPHFAVDTGAGLSLTGWRVGFRLRANLLKSEWTPFLGAGMSYATGSGGQAVDGEAKGEKFKLVVEPSPFAQFGGGVNYTGKEGFVFTAATGYAVLLKDSNTRFVSGSKSAYDDFAPIFEGGLILSVAFGYAF